MSKRHAHQTFTDGECTWYSYHKKTSPCLDLLAVTTMSATDLFSLRKKNPLVHNPFLLPFFLPAISERSFQSRDLPEEKKKKKKDPLPLYLLPFKKSKKRSSLPCKDSQGRISNRED